MFNMPYYYSNEKEDQYFKGIPPKSLNYENYCLKVQTDEKLKQRETFCEGFCLCSLPFENFRVLDICKKFNASCGHELCKSGCAINPGVILKYPLEKTENLEINDGTASVCFPHGIKLCHSEKEQPKMMKDFDTWITNDKGFKIYMKNFHFYLKMSPKEFSMIYNISLVDYYIKAFQNVEKPKGKSTDLDGDYLNSLLNPNFVYIPCCICLISKYGYEKQMEACLECIYQLLIQNKDLLKEESKLIYLIKYLINSVPIPDIESNVVFYITHTDPSKQHIKITNPNLDAFKAKDNLYELFELFSSDNIIEIFSMLLFEQRLIFVDDDIARLNRVTYYFKELLYPVNWVHVYIPIIKFDTTTAATTFLPYIIGIDVALLDIVLKIDEMNEDEEIKYLIFLQEKGESSICPYKHGSMVIEKTSYYSDLLKSILKYDLKEKLDGIKKKVKEPVKGEEKININLEIRDCFIEIFAQMFHNINKYLGLVDNNIAFNRTLFLEGIEEKEKDFYSQVVDSQLFDYFITYFMKEEFKQYNKYFINKIEFYNKTNETFETFVKQYEVKEIYKIKPDFLKANKDNINQNNSRIVENIEGINSVIKNNNIFKSKIFDIYLIPEKTEQLKKQKENKGITNIKTIEEKNKKDYKILRREKLISLINFEKIDKEGLKKDKIKEKEIEKMKEFINDFINEFMTKIFKSDESQMDIGKKSVLKQSCKKDIQTLLNTSIGRKHFIFLLHQNKHNTISLKKKFFDILGDLIYKTLLLLKKEDMSEENIVQIIQLTSSTKYFERRIEEKEKIKYHTGEERENWALWDEYNKIIQKKIGYFYDMSFWTNWCDILLKEKSKKGKKEEEKNEVIKSIILRLCDLMIECDLSRDFITSSCSFLIEAYLEKEKEKKELEMIKRDIMNHIDKRLI